MKIRVYETTGASQSKLLLQKLFDRLNNSERPAEQRIAHLETEERSGSSLDGKETALLELIGLSLKKEIDQDRAE